MKTVSSVLFLAAAGVLAAEKPVHAYLDPGNTSLILQGLVGGIAAALVVLKTYWHRITSIFRRTPGRDEAGH